MKNSQNLSESVSEQPWGNPEDFQRSLSNKKDKIWLNFAFMLDSLSRGLKGLPP
jgi:hypothetical protein